MQPLRHLLGIFTIVLGTLLPLPLSAANDEPPALETRIKDREFRSSDVVGTIAGNEITRAMVEEFILIRHRQESAKLFLDYDGQQRALERMALLEGYRDRYLAFAEGRQDHADWVVRRSRMFVINDRMKHFEEMPVTNEELRAYYDANPEEFRLEERRHVRHLFKEVPEKATPEEKEAIRTRVEALRKEIAGGVPFAEVAERESEQESAKRGGDIGLIERGTLKMKPFVDAAFSLQAGELSGVVETPYGFHLITVDEILPGEVIPFETVVAKGNLEYHLRRHRARVQSGKYLERLKQEHEVATMSLEPSGIQDVLFRVDGRDFTCGDLLLYYTKYPRETWDAVLRQLTPIPGDLADEAIFGELIHEDAIANGIPSEERRQKAERIARDWSAYQLWLEDAVTKAEADSPAEVERYYTENAPRFVRYPDRELSQIVINAQLPAEATPADRKRAMEAALERANAACAAIAGGMPFDEAAKSFSDGADGASGGYLGVVSADRIGPYLEKAAAPLKAGQVSDPLETRTGYLIVKLHAKTEERTMTLEEATPTISQILRTLKTQAIEAALLDDLRSGGFLAVREEMF